MDILYDRIISGKKHLIKAAGLSTESPPTAMNGELLASGSQYVQVDTGILQMFDGREGYWYNFAQFDTGSSASTSASLGGGLGGSLGGSSEQEEPGDGEDS